MILKGGKMSESKTSVAPANSSGSKKADGKDAWIRWVLCYDRINGHDRLCVSKFCIFWSPFDLLLDSWRCVLVLASRARGC